MKFWTYWYSVLALNLTRDMGRFIKMLSKTWQRAALDTETCQPHDA